MKKKLFGIIILAWCCVCLGTAFDCSAAYIWDESVKVKLGDVQKDNVVDLKDLVRIMKYVENSSEEIAERASDMNSDAKVDESDEMLLRKQLAGGDQYWSNVY